MGKEKAQPPAAVTAIAAIVVLVPVLWVGCKMSSCADSITKTESAPAALPAGYDPNKADERKKLVQDMINEGVFNTVRAADGHFGHVVVGAKFPGLAYDNKKLFTNAVFCYYLDQDKEFRMVTFHDPYTNAKIASFHREAGFEMK